MQFTLPRDGARKARTVVQTVRMARFELPPRGGKPLQVTAILAREEHPPEGETPVEWRLLTNEVLTSLEQCCERIDWYRRRWIMEIFFRILKSGCRVEALQLETRERLERALAIYLIVAWRILALVTLGRECPELSCEVVFAPEEWQAAWIVARRERPPEHTAHVGADDTHCRQFRWISRTQWRRAPRPQGTVGRHADVDSLRREYPIAARSFRS